jgi:hypothetical protein
MANFIDHYKVLQVDINADKEIIDAAYRKLCKKYHPDVNKNIIAKDKIVALNAAYEILGNNAKRAEYDLQRIGRNIGTKAASDVLCQYFMFLAKRDHSKAYSLLCEKDKANIGSKEFIEWQGSVSKLYQIISCCVDHDDFRVISETGWHLIEFAVTITERDIASDKIIDERSVRKVIYEETGWKVFLGYRDIKKYVARFQCLSLGLLKEKQIESSASLYEKKAFFRALQTEFERSRRHSRVFCVALIRIKSEKLRKKSKKHPLINKIVANLRITDSVLSVNPAFYILLLPETDISGAVFVCEKLESMTQDFIDSSGCFYYGLSGYSEQSPVQCMREAKLALWQSIRSQK